MIAGAFKGATAWEWWIGPLWGRFEFPRYWTYRTGPSKHHRRRWSWPLRFGWDKEWNVQ